MHGRRRAALRSLRLDRDSLVLTSTMTFCGAVHAIEHAGLQPVLVDVDPETGMPTPETVARAVEGCERRPAAMVLVHWAGDRRPRSAGRGRRAPADRVVEDAAHGLGSSWGGTDVGTGSAVCFSFYATKNLPVGEGGMVTTDDPDRAAWIRRTRLHGMSQDAWRRYLPGGSWRYDVAESGLKANMSDLSAAIGRAQLAALPEWQDRRALLAARYDALLAGVPGVRLPHRPDRPGSARLAPVRRAGRRRAARATTSPGGWPSGESAPPSTSSPCTGSATSRGSAPPGGLPGADLMFDRLLSLPLYPRLTTGQVDDVAAALADELEGAHR